MKFYRSSLATLVILAVTPLAVAQGGSFGVRNPFSPPDATVHFAPDRQFDLTHLALELVVDYPNRSVTGKATNSITALRDGITDLKFHAGSEVNIDDVKFDGIAVSFKRVVDGLLVQSPAMKAGQKASVAIAFHFKKGPANSTGFHWLEPTKGEPNKIGFWTNGESEQTRDWVPTWDYPNDFTTSETKTTVPADWSVIGNGNQISNVVSADKKTRTVVWRLDIPHATYLTSVLAGPLDIKHDKWRGVDLWYVVPRGRGNLIDYSFGHTKDMLSFYSDRLGYKYPWPKYAQDATYEFGGGQENVSATTLGQDFLTDKRSEIYGMDSLNSHELGHQWFGDTVTCKDWGQIWLNESFATVMQMLYFEHSRGLYAYQREIEDNSQAYFAESRRYKRPLVTNLYVNPEVMFDEHTYPKGGVLLHSLRRFMGDEPFFKGLGSYLKKNQHTPVETSQLIEALTDSSGINVQPWFNQWIYKPGHPVIDWSWSWDAPKNQVVVHVKQTQSTADGTPIFEIPAKVGLIKGGLDRRAIQLNAADQEFRLDATSKPDAVVFDPDHDFLREIRTQPWATDELPAIVKYAPNCIDRVQAAQKLLTNNPDDAAVNTVVEAYKADKGPFPAFTGDAGLVRLAKPALIPFFEDELKHECYSRRESAVRALGHYKTPEANKAIRSVVSDDQPYGVVANAIIELGQNDFAGNADVIRRYASDPNSSIRSAALTALVENNDPGSADLLFKALDPDQPDDVRAAGYRALQKFKGDDPRIVPALRAGLKDSGGRVLFEVLQIIQERKLKEMIPDLDELAKQRPRFAGFIDQIKKSLQG